MLHRKSRVGKTNFRLEHLRGVRGATRQQRKIFGILSAQIHPTLPNPKAPSPNGQARPKPLRGLTAAPPRPRFGQASSFHRRKLARDERRSYRSMMRKRGPIVLALGAAGALLLGVPASTPAVTPSADSPKCESDAMIVVDASGSMTGMGLAKLP
jgi:hypothetical protein